MHRAAQWPLSGPMPRTNHSRHVCTVPSSFPLLPEDSSFQPLVPDILSYEVSSHFNRICHQRTRLPTQPLQRNTRATTGLTENRISWQRRQRAHLSFRSSTAHAQCQSRTSRSRAHDNWRRLITGWYRAPAPAEIDPAVAACLHVQNDANRPTTTTTTKFL